MTCATAGAGAGAGLAKVLADQLKARQDVTEDGRIGDALDPIYANLSHRVAAEVKAGIRDRAIPVCGTGIGAGVAADKGPGIRAALTHGTVPAVRLALSNAPPIITTGARVIGPELAKIIAVARLAPTMHFAAAGNAACEVDAIEAIDTKNAKGRTAHAALGQ